MLLDCDLGCSVQELGGPAGDFSAKSFESGKNPSCKKTKKISGPRTDGRTNFVNNLLPPTHPPPWSNNYIPFSRK